MAVSQITPTLYLSGAEGALNAALVSHKGITLIVNATLTQALAIYPGVESVRVPVSDLPSAPLDRHFDPVAERIHGNNSGGTLVHCAAGVSRSPALVMAYLMRFRGVTLKQAHGWVRDKRPSIRPNRGFWEQLLRYEQRLYGKNTVRLANEQEVGAGTGPMTTQLTTTRQTTPQARLKPSITTQTPLTPRLKRTEPVGNRTCLSLVPKSPLMIKRQNKPVHSGSVAGSRQFLLKNHKT